MLLWEGERVGGKMAGWMVGWRGLSYSDIETCLIQDCVSWVEHGKRRKHFIIWNINHRKLENFQEILLLFIRYSCYLLGAVHLLRHTGWGWVSKVCLILTGRGVGL